MFFFPLPHSFSFLLLHTLSSLHSLCFHLQLLSSPLPPLSRASTAVEKYLCHLISNLRRTICSLSLSSSDPSPLIGSSFSLVRFGFDGLAGVVLEEDNDNDEEEGLETETEDSALQERYSIGRQIYLFTKRETEDGI